MSPYLITQATGQQGQSIIRHLLEAGATVHALVRDPSKIPAILENPSVKLFKGESQDTESVFKAAQGCKAAFLNTFPIPGLETQQAQSIVDACKKAGIENIVSASTICTGDRSKWDAEEFEQTGLRSYFSSKAAVEEIVRGAGFKNYTILRPGFIHVDFYFPNVYANFPALPKTGNLDHVYNEGARMIYTDVNDIGKYGAAALQNPEKFNGEEIELAGDYLTIDDIRDILVKVSGRKVETKKRTMEELKEADLITFSLMFHQWSNVRDFSDKMQAAKDVQAKFGIPLNTIEQAMQRDKDELLKCLPA